MQKSFKIFLGIYAVAIIVFTIIGAFAGDVERVKIYDPLTNTIYIYRVAGNNSQLQAEYTLLKNSEFCTSTDCYAEGTARLYIPDIAITSSYFRGLNNNYRNLSHFFTLDPYGEKERYNGRIVTPGSYYWRLDGSKMPRESVDWVINALGFNFTEWAYWRAWQDYNDDFEDGLINDTLWINATDVCSYGGSTSTSTNYVNEVTGSDGYINMVAYGVSGAGTNNGRWSAVKTQQDFKDGLNYEINLTLGYRSDYKTRISIVNKTLAAVMGENCAYLVPMNQTLLYEFPTAPYTNGTNYTITINGATGNFSLKNESGVLNSTLTTLDKWYLAFETFTYCTNCEYNNTMRIFNFTVRSFSLALTINHLSPDNETIISNYNPYFQSTINMTNSYDAHNVTNATLYVWNMTGSIMNTSFIDLGSNRTSVNVNLSATNLNYSTYYWNYLAWGTDGTSFKLASGPNRTITINDTTNPSLVIDSPESTVDNRTLNITISASDRSGLSYCYFYIKRGASYEVDNTQIVNCFNASATVSGDAEYNIYVVINDTKNNQNATFKTFTVDGSGTIAPPIIVNSGGGGGGTTVITQVIGINNTVQTGQICIPIKDKLKLTWKNAKDNKFSGDYLISVVKDFLDYGFCSSAASIVPL